MSGSPKAAVRLRQLARCRGRVKGLLDSTVCHPVVWALTRTYGVVYFYNVIIPPPATTLLKLCACWGKNSVKSPADPDTAEHKPWSSGLWRRTQHTWTHNSAQNCPHATSVVTLEPLLACKLLATCYFDQMDVWHAFFSDILV